MIYGARDDDETKIYLGNVALDDACISSPFAARGEGLCTSAA